MPHLPAGIANGIGDVLRPEPIAKWIRDEQADQEQQRHQAEPLHTEPHAEHQHGSGHQRQDPPAGARPDHGEQQQGQDGDRDHHPDQIAEVSPVCTSPPLPSEPSIAEGAQHDGPHRRQIAGQKIRIKKSAGWPGGSKPSRLHQCPSGLEQAHAHQHRKQSGDMIPSFDKTYKQIEQRGIAQQHHEPLQALMGIR